MAARKRNEWLDVEESEEDEQGNESEEESRARTLPSSKRRKVSHESDVEEDDAEDNNDFDNRVHYSDDDPSHTPPTTKSQRAELAHLESLAAGLPSELKLTSNRLDKPLTSSIPRKDKSGVIYISRVPPFMKPQVLRSLLTPYGAIGRIFLTPESAASRTQRLKSGGTRRKLFLDGWVEFVHKRDAKFVAENLNAQTMGGKKRGRWHDEVWNIKYLSGVKWSHLVEQIQNENAERAARLRFEIAQGRKENRAFLENVEKGKMISGIEAKRRERGGEEEEGGEAGSEMQRVEESEVLAEKPRRRGRREFTQHTVTSKAVKKPEAGQDVQRVLSSIF